MQDSILTDNITLAQLRQQLQSDDFTTYPIENLSDLTPDNALLHRYIRNLINEKWSEIAKEMGLKHPQSCYSADFPPEAVRIRLEHLISDKVVEILHNDAVCANITEQIVIPTLDSGANPDECLRNTVYALMKTIDYESLVTISEENSCDTDFNEHKAQNFPKLDHERKWHHSRCKSPTISIESLSESSEENGGVDIEDNAVDVEESAIANADINMFLKTCNETDQRIIRMLLDKYTQQEIATELGISQGTISKRIAKIRTRLEEFLSL